MDRTFRGVEIPANEEARVEAVRSYEIVQTPPEREYDDITELAALLTGCPVSYISIFDATRSWLKSSYGLPKNRPPRPRELSMCAPTICQTEMILIPDLSANPRYASLPAVTDPPHARFYCGVPLINRDSYALGTLCVWHHDTLELSDIQKDAMIRLARLTLGHLERRRDLLAMKRAVADVESELARSLGALERAEQVAYRLLPAAAAVRLLSGADVMPRVYENVGIIGVGLSGLGQPNSGARALADKADALSAYVAELDRVVGAAGLERIGVIGESYYAACGMPRASGDPEAHARLGAELMQSAVQKVNIKRKCDGQSVVEGATVIELGNVVTAVVGESRANYVVWGEAIDKARDRLAELRSA